MAQKEYGPHKYADHDGTSDCKYNCGCWMGPSRSGGPLGLDPDGKCPGNPVDGNFLSDENPVSSKRDYEEVVKQRIRNLASRAYTAEEKLKTIEPDKLQLGEQLKAAQTRAAQFECDLLNMAREMWPYLEKTWKSQSKG